MRVFPRRGAAMSPREKHLFLLFALLLLSVTFYCFPFLLYLTLILAVCCVICLCLSGEPFPASLGLNPRAWLNVPGALRRWLRGFGDTGASVGPRGKTKHGGNHRAQLRESEGYSGHSEWNRREPLGSDSFLFSPRDFLMGSYIGKPGSPAADHGRPRPSRNPREQLRERLCRPNHAVHTPTRRLSFTGEPLGAFGRFTITPQRHYPLQMPGVSSVGVLPPVKWDGFMKKNVLSPRNSSASLSPVTVKIARPNHNLPSVDQLNSPGLSGLTTDDPCSRESVLRVLKESRKRDVEDEDRSFSVEQKSKRRRNDSGGSSHSAFEPLLPNGTPSQLVPKPGNLKRGISSLAEESTMKRSRTSSISSGSGQVQRGTPGSRRNAIQSSYSSSLALDQWKKPSAPSSPLSSPGSSRCQTPEGVAKRPREDDGQSPSSVATVRSDPGTSEKSSTTSKITPIPKIPITTSTTSTGSGGKRKRKIQLVSSNRDDNISLPPPPELGYTITVKDLDEEKKAGISKIQKVLETLEPSKPLAPQPNTSTPPSIPPSTSTVTLSSLLAAPLPTSSASSIPVINLDPSPGSSSSTPTTATTATTTTLKAPNSLMEALKMNISAPASTPVPAASITTVSGSSTPFQLGSTKLPVLPTATATPIPSASQPSSLAPESNQVTQAPLSTTTGAGSGLFGLTSQTSSAPSGPNPAVITATASPPVTMFTSSSNSSGSGSSTNPLLVSQFKPIFAVTSASATPASETKPVVQSFKPVFGGVSSASVFGQGSSVTNTTSAATSVSLSTTTSLFGATTNNATVAPPAYPGLTTASPLSAGSIPSNPPAAQPDTKSPFVNWTTPSSTSTATVQPQNTGGTFQFGASQTSTPAPAPTVVKTNSTQAPFTFGAAQSDPQATTQKVFAFNQAASTQSTTTASFGGFAMSNATSTSAATTTQPTFAFGKSTFEPQPAPSTFGSSAAPSKPFSFGAVAASSTPASNSTTTQFSFGATAATSASTFSTQAKPTFGASTTGFGFGANATPSVAPSAPPTFGATQTQNAAPPSTTFTFGGAATQQTPAQPATGGFNFNAGVPCPQFGTPASNSSAPQMGAFNFGAAASDKPTFGTPTPSFGQCNAVGPSPFGSPGTPAQGFTTVPFGSPAGPSFSIGAGSRSTTRQRLQARRTHNRKKN